MTEHVEIRRGDSVASLVEELASSATDSSLTLPSERAVAEGEWVRFTLVLVDGTAVMEGVGQCRGSMPRGNPIDHHDVTLVELQFDERNEIMWERLLIAAEAAKDGDETGTIKLGDGSFEEVPPAAGKRAPPPLPKSSARASKPPPATASARASRPPPAPAAKSSRPSKPPAAGTSRPSTPPPVAKSTRTSSPPPAAAKSSRPSKPPAAGTRPSTPPPVAKSTRTSSPPPAASNASRPSKPPPAGAKSSRPSKPPSAASNASRPSKPPPAGAKASRPSKPPPAASKSSRPSKPPAASPSKPPAAASTPVADGHPLAVAADLVDRARELSPRLRGVVRRSPGDAPEDAVLELALRMGLAALEAERD